MNITSAKRVKPNSPLFFAAAACFPSSFHPIFFFQSKNNNNNNNNRQVKKWSYKGNRNNGRDWSFGSSSNPDACDRRSRKHFGLVPVRALVRAVSLVARLHLGDDPRRLGHDLRPEVEPDAKAENGSVDDR